MSDIPRQRWVVLDRDGTIIQERHYLSDPAQIELIPGASEGLRQIQDMGLGLVLITNQSGVGRGYFDLERLELIHHNLVRLLDAEDVCLDRIYFCPHMPESNCRCRKPETGLLEQAARDLRFDPRYSFVIGDKGSDIGMGQRVSAATVLVRTGYGAEVERNGSANPDYIVDGLEDAALVIQRTLATKNIESGLGR